MAHVERLSKLFAASKRSNGPRFRRITTVSTTEHSEKKDSTTAVASTTQDDDHVGVASDDRDSRTVFVGNLPLSSNKKTVRKLFTQYGHIETIRFRSAAVAPGKLPVGVARRLHRQLTGSCINCYIVFSSKESVTGCLELNGTDMSGRHLRVDRVTHTADHTHSVFVGNVPFSADEEQLRALFERCGQVTSVRVVRDKTTGIGKGFAYVLFTDTSGVLFACQQSGNIELDGRKLRVFQSKNRPTGTHTAKPTGNQRARPTGNHQRARPTGNHQRARPTGNHQRARPTGKQRARLTGKQRAETTGIQTARPTGTQGGVQSFMGTRALTRSELKNRRSNVGKKPKHASRKSL